MSLYRKILFPIDFSDQCETVAPYIVDIANRFQAKLHLLHVNQEGKKTSNLQSILSENLIAFAESRLGGMHWAQTVTAGEPAQTIVRYAESQGVDLIAMPTSGKGGLRRWILGSTTENVLRQASCAVWTETASGDAHVRWSPILCAIDLEPGSERVLSYANRVAAHLNVRLAVVHAIPPTSDGLWLHPSDLPSALSCTTAQHALERLLEKLNVRVVDPVIETAAVVNAVTRVASQTGAKLLVIGRGGHGRRQIGTHTYDLVANAPCPVLTVPSRQVSTQCFWTEWQQDSAEQYADTLLARAC
jgi:nucleotide-binding universal stress UspA family protein